MELKHIVNIYFRFSNSAIHASMHIGTCIRTHIYQRNKEERKREGKSTRRLHCNRYYSDESSISPSLSALVLHIWTLFRNANYLRLCCCWCLFYCKVIGRHWPCSHHMILWLLLFFYIMEKYAQKRSRTTELKFLPEWRVFLVFD